MDEKQNADLKMYFWDGVKEEGKKRRDETAGYFSLARWFLNKDQNLFEGLIIRSTLNSFDIRTAGSEI